MPIAQTRSWLQNKKQSAVVPMAGRAAQMYAEISEISNYCEAVPLNRGQDATSNKIEEMLFRIRRIDKSMQTLANSAPTSPTRPSVPPKPRKGSQGKPPFQDGLNLLPGSISAGRPTPGGVTPPPRPRKPSSPTAVAPHGTGRNLPKPECDFLVAQLRNVKAYLDEMVDDGFDEKTVNMQCLDSVINALTCH